MYRGFPFAAHTRQEIAISGINRLHPIVVVGSTTTSEGAAVTAEKDGDTEGSLVATVGGLDGATDGTDDGNGEADLLVSFLECDRASTIDTVRQNEQWKWVNKKKRSKP